MDAGPKPISQKRQHLASWKEIASYLDRDVRTVQRWESTRGLPVHRLPGGGRSPIYALKSELDDWWARTPARQERRTVVPMPARRSWLGLWLAVVLTVVAVIGARILSRWNETPAPLRVLPLTSLPGAESAPALSPDGRRLAFSWLPADSRNVDVYVVDLPDGSPRRITDDPAVDMFAEWSPDGRRLAYARASPGGEKYELRLSDLSSGSDRKLLENEIPGTVTSPPWVHVWTPDGGGLIFSCPRERGGPLGMVLLSLKTGIEHRLTPPVSGVVGEVTPALAPDGHRLAFQRRTPAGGGNLFVLDLKADFTAAGPPRQITFEKCCLEAPSWTRDGKEIVFVSWRDGTRRLARIPAGGGSIRFDPGVPVAGFAPRIAPDGRLVFHDSITVGNIFRVDLRDSGLISKVLIASSRIDGQPAYSPDGEWIVFTSDRGGLRQLWVCDSEGRGVRQLTHLDEVSAWYPTCSPDGRWVAFEGRRGSEAHIYLADSRSGEASPLRQGDDEGQRPRWSRDGRRLYFTSGRTGQYEIWYREVDREGRAGAATQLTRRGGYSGYESVDGRYFYYSDWTFKQLRRIATAGGPEEPVRSDAPFSRYPANLAAGARGLYYAGQSSERGTPLCFLPFDRGFPSRIGMLSRMPSLFGIAVSPDDHWLLVSQFEQARGDILSVPGFR